MTAAPVVTAGAEQLTPDELTAYTGLYRHNEQASFTFVLDEEKRLRARLTGQPFLPLESLGSDRFKITVVAAEYQFQRGADGRVARVVLHQNGNELAADRTGDAPAILFPPVEKLRDYAGSYELAPGLVFDITAGTYTLASKLTGQPTFAVHCIRPDHFVYDVVDAALTFERDEQGKVVALILHQNGLDQRAPRRSATK